jgi:hypothetical protein
MTGLTLGHGPLFQRRGLGDCRSASCDPGDKRRVHQIAQPGVTHHSRCAGRAPTQTVAPGTELCALGPQRQRVELRRLTQQRLDRVMEYVLFLELGDPYAGDLINPVHI